MPPAAGFGGAGFAAVAAGLGAVWVGLGEEGCLGAAAIGGCLGAVAAGLAGFGSGAGLGAATGAVGLASGSAGVATGATTGSSGRSTGGGVVAVTAGGGGASGSGDAAFTGSGGGSGAEEFPPRRRAMMPMSAAQTPTPTADPNAKTFSRRHEVRVIVVTRRHLRLHVDGLELEQRRSAARPVLCRQLGASVFLGALHLVREDNGWSASLLRNVLFSHTARTGLGRRFDGRRLLGGRGSWIGRELPIEVVRSFATRCGFRRRRRERNGDAE